MTSLLQRSQRATQAEGKVFGHPHADNHVRFLCAVSVLRNGGEGHADKAFLVEKLGEQIDVKRLDALVEDDQPVVSVFDLTNGSRHRFSLRRLSA